MATIMNLFEAFTQDKLPREGGFIITEHLEDTSRYARYEIISYGNVKSIYMVEADGLVFQADGRKIYVLFEPLNYSSKHIEPSYRDDAHRIPYRLSELEVMPTKRHEKIMIAKEPVETYTSFTIANETGLNTSYIVTKDDSTASVILGFFEQSFWKTLNTSRTDARNACDLMVRPLEMLLKPFVE